jgi:hypothetical protein
MFFFFCDFRRYFGGFSFARFASLHSFANRHGSSAAYHRDRPVAVAPLDGDEVGFERAGERQPTGGE